MTTSEQIQQMLATRSCAVRNLDDVVITTELQERPSRLPNHEAENTALTTLARTLATTPHHVLQKLCEIAQDLCQAHSAGISIEEEVEGEWVFRWRAVSGEMEQYLQAVMPRDFSPCGIVVDRNDTQLFTHLVEHYPYVEAIEPPISEVLLIPFRVAGKPVGTVWVVSSSPARRFDREDARILTNLGQFAAAAYQVLQRQEDTEKANIQLSADLTERTEAMAVTIKNEHYLRSILDSSADCITVMDLEGCLQSMNQQGLHLMEVADFTSIAGQAWTDFWRGEEQAKATAALALARSGERSHFQGYCETALGTLKWWDVLITSVPDDAGQPEFLVGVSRDLTELRETAQILEEKNQEIEALNARLRQSMTETHHRVKNNLQLISALIEMQAGTGTDTVPMSELTRLSTNVQALGVIHDVLTQEAKTDMVESTLSVKTVLEKLLAMLQQTLTHHYHLSYVIAEARLPGRKVTSLALVTNELFSNALKHGKSKVDVIFRVEDQQAILTVRDDGIGFPDDFNPLTAANTGLSLIETITDHDLRGQVAYNNTVEGGGQVTLRFPLSTTINKKHI